MSKKLDKFFLLFFFMISHIAHADIQDKKIMAIQQARIQALELQVAKIKEAVKGNVLTLQVSKCGPAHYGCSVRSCIDSCLAKGGRVAHRHEFADTALKGDNHCAYTITYDATNNRFDAGYPMYNYQGSGCVNSNKIPTMLVNPVNPSQYEQAIANCACMIPTGL